MNPIPCAIILSRPEDSRNIGSVCRAMMTMNCMDLRIVGRRDDYDEKQVRMLAVHAGEVWDRARFFDPDTEGLTAATGDCSLVAGTTRRMGQWRKSWGMTPEQFAGHLKESPSGLAAVVFGNERTGLTDEELDRCSLAVNIPSNPAFPSLNLSHAVQIMTYTLFIAFDGKKRGYRPIDQARIRSMVKSIDGDIDRIGLFKRVGREDNIRFLSEIIARTAFSESEAKRLEELFHRMAWIKNGSVPDK